MSVGCGRLGGLPLLGVPLTIPGQQVVSMTETTSPLVMVKRFGVSLAEAQRVQALLRLGVTEQDVQIAERLMSSTPSGEVDHKNTKVEWLLGCGIGQMSRLKALEVLGISSTMLEEEKARILGSLGVKAWGNLRGSAVKENPHDDVRACLTRKRVNTAIDAPRVPAPVCGMAAPSPSEVAELEDECLSQHLRIQQLELQVAALSLSESCAGKEKGQG